MLHSPESMRDIRHHRPHGSIPTYLTACLPAHLTYLHSTSEVPWLIGIM